MLVVLSPHLDDAIFSCGDLVCRAPEVRIVTICAGVPAASVELSHFDAMAGFASAAEAVRTRRAEDAAAAVIAGAELIHLGCIEDQYDRAPLHGERVEAAVQDAFERYTESGDVVLAPLGLRHPDHEHVAKAARELLGIISFDLWLYEELPYRALWPEYVAPALRAAGHTEADQVGAAATPAKHRALRCYPSQLVGMDTRALILPERYYCKHGSAQLP